jgi:hypothetical protein
MPAQLHFDGFYYSGPVPWEDWHAGIRMHGTRFHYIRYYANGNWLGCYRDHDFDFWRFTESVTHELFADAKRDRAPRIADADLCVATMLWRWPSKLITIRALCEPQQRGMRVVTVDPIQSLFGLGNCSEFAVEWFCTEVVAQLGSRLIKLLREDKKK